MSLLGILGTIGAIGGGAGGIMNLLGSLGIGNQSVPVENVNPYTDDTMRQFQELLGMSDEQMGSLMQLAQASTGRLGGVQSDLAGLQDEIRGVSAPGVREGYNLYQERRPELESQALDFATRATQPYQERAGEVAERRADQVARDILGQFGGQGFSGAAGAAASRGAADVLSNYETGVADRFGQIATGLAGQSLGQERGLSEAAPQQNFANIINTLLNQANLAQARGGSIAQQAGLYGQQGAEYGARSRSLLSGLGGLSAPQYMEQTQTNPLMGFGTALSNLSGGLYEDFLNLDAGGILDLS